MPDGTTNPSRAGHVGRRPVCGSYGGVGGGRQSGLSRSLPSEVFDDEETAEGQQCVTPPPPKKKQQQRNNSHLNNEAMHQPISLTTRLRKRCV